MVTPVTLAPASTLTATGSPSDVKKSATQSSSVVSTLSSAASVVTRQTGLVSRVISLPGSFIRGTCELVTTVVKRVYFFARNNIFAYVYPFSRVIANTNKAEAAVAANKKAEAARVVAFNAAFQDVGAKKVVVEKAQEAFDAARAAAAEAAAASDAAAEAEEKVTGKKVKVVPYFGLRLQMPKAAAKDAEVVRDAAEKRATSEKAQSALEEAERALAAAKESLVGAEEVLKGLAPRATSSK